MKTGTGAAPIRESTEKSYLSILKIQTKFSVAKHTVDWEEPFVPTILQVVQDLVARTDLADSTRVPYRAALLWYLRGQPAHDQNFIQALTILEGLQKPRGRTKSRTQPKTISTEDLEILINEINRRAKRSIWARRTALWLRAGLATGLRPIEWIHADWTSDQKTALTVKTAKVKLLAPAFMRAQTSESNLHSHAREGHELDEHYYQDPQQWEFNQDKYREVPVPSGIDQAAVQFHMDALRDYVRPEGSTEEQGAQFEVYYAQCAGVLRGAVRKIWGLKRAYTLGTMRGQFAANMKSAFGADVTAEVMGHHSSESPSTAHYGGRHQAHAAFKGVRQDGPDPMPERFRKLLDAKEEKIHVE